VEYLAERSCKQPHLTASLSAMREHSPVARVTPENADPSSHWLVCDRPALCDCVLPGSGDCEGRQELHAPSMQTMSCHVQG
jgi:hypothetical protein